MSKIYFNFWDFKIKLDCESEKICDLLKKGANHLRKNIFGQIDLRRVLSIPLKTGGVGL